jgi:hypothetical protein
LVGIVTCLEVTTRQVIQRLIDHGTPYVERIEKFKDFLKFDLSVTRALHDKKVSFGELVSHLVPINNIENISSHLGVLLDGNLSFLLANLKPFVEPDYEQFLDEDDLKELESAEEIDFIEESEEEIETEIPEFLVDDVNQLLSNLSKIFTLRHIIVHEANFEAVTSEDDLMTFFNSAITFAKALEELVDQTLNPNTPRSPMISAMADAKEANLIEIQMESLYTDIYSLVSDGKKPMGTSEKAALENSQKVFLEYLQAEVELEEVLVSPASGYMLSAIYAYIAKDLLNQRIKRLEDIKTFHIEFDKD